MLLIVDKSLANAKTYADIFYFMGIISYAVTPAQAFSEIDNGYTAILLTGIENATYDDEFLRTLKAMSLRAPIFAICKNVQKYLSENKRFSAVDDYFNDNVYSTTVVNEIEKYQRRNHTSPISVYSCSGLDLSIKQPYPLYLNKSIGFSKTEAMIIRYFICRYPLPVTADEVLKYAFKPGRAPEISSVRTHICVINKKFKRIANKTLIEHERGVGYVLKPPLKVDLVYEELPD